MISFVAVIAATIAAAQEDVISPLFIAADDYVSVSSADDELVQSDADDYVSLTSADDEIVRSEADDYVSVTSADDEIVRSDAVNDADSVYVDGVLTAVAAGQFADGEPVDSDEHVIADEINDASIDDAPIEDRVADGTPTEDVVLVNGTPTENDILPVDGMATENIAIDGTPTEASVDDNGLTIPVDFDLTFFDDLFVNGFTTGGVGEDAPAGIVVHDGTVTDDYMIDGLPSDYGISNSVDDGFDKSGDEDDVKDKKYDDRDGRADEHTNHGALTRVTGAMCMAAIALF